ncbi:helix-turn-helix transcriptional regulator [Haloplanus sp. C73]|uniref:helix-turn-helix transcriptional regulator n=1 Tax=Haloplanus sp. C73 TaxID=3421641 RepID=UPI003EBEB290
MTTVVVAVLLLSAVVPAAGALASSSPPAQFDGGAVHQQSVETDSVRLIVSVDENGSATWSVQYWTRLDDENTSDAFESLQSDIRSNPSNFSDSFASRMRSTVTAAENATGREMSASDFSVRAETRTPPEYGVIVYTFQWENFAAVDGDTLRVGDAIEGLFLDQRTRLVIEWPSSYALADVAPDPDERRDGAVVWRGSETSFVSGEPSVVLQPASAGTDSPGADGSILPLVGVGLLLVGAGVVAWRYRDRFGGSTPDSTGGEDTSDTDGAATADAGGTSTPPDDLLSNEERVIQFVREQGGRVKQQEIVEAFDWTEARTSQIVRDLREQGDLEGFRLGRENVLKLSETDDESED